MGLYLGKEKISNLSVGQATSGVTNISDETTINISGILKGENNKIVPATPGVDYVVPGDSTVTSVNGQTGAVILSASDIGAQSTITVNGILKGDGTGGVSTAVPGRDYLTEAPVTSVNGKTGDVEFAASDVGALPTTGGSMTGNIMFTGSGGAHYGIVGVSGSGSLAIGLGRSTITFSDKTRFTGKVDFSAAKIEGITGLLPTITESDNGKFLRVVNGKWAAVEIANANGGSF